MPTPIKRLPFDEVLIKRGILSDSERDRFVAQAKTTGQSLKAVLLEEGILTETLLAQTLADQYGLPWDPLQDFRVDPEFFQIIPVEWMHRYPFVPLAKGNGAVTIAVANPQDLRAIDELELLLGMPVRLVVSSPSAIREALAASEGNKQVLSRIKAELDPVLVKEDE
ncbi:MAG: pilus assembly protein PilB, partial [Nitrospirae bacterium]